MSSEEPWVAIVTGGAAGIGAAISRKLASRGINVLIADIQVAAGERLATELESEFKVDACFARVDVSKEQEVIDMVDTAVRRWGRLDYAANVAGICQDPPADETSLTTELFDRHFAEPRDVVLHPEPRMPIKPQRGAVVNVASTTAVNGMGWPAYAPTKHAVLSITKNGALFYGPQGIRCNSIAPGATLTEMALANSNPDAVRGDSQYTKPIALKTWSMPEEQAGVASFLLSPESSYVTGVNIMVDGGFTNTRS